MDDFSLHGLLHAQRAMLIERWQRCVKEMLGAEDLSRAELIDSMPAFLDELEATLAPAVPSALPDESAAAPDHGSQRFRKGFDVGEVIRSTASSATSSWRPRPSWAEPSRPPRSASS